MIINIKLKYSTVYGVECEVSSETQYTIYLYDMTVSLAKFHDVLHQHPTPDPTPAAISKIKRLHQSCDATKVKCTYK